MTTSSSSSSGIKWVWGLVGVGALIWLFNATQEDSDRSSKGGSYTQPSPSPIYTPSPAQPTRQSGFNFSKPSVGQGNMLSVAQIRWCLRQEIWIEVLRSKPTTNAQIDQFNDLISDYNSRCGNFRYRQGALARARREVEQQRLQIVADVSPPWSQLTFQSRSVQFSELTFVIQRSLKELGYDPGPVDGVYGARTKSAIQSFQHDVSMFPDGQNSQELLIRLRQESTTRRTRSTKTSDGTALGRERSTSSVTSRD